MLVSWVKLSRTQENFNLKAPTRLSYLSIRPILVRRDVGQIAVTVGVEDFRDNNVVALVPASIFALRLSMNGVSRENPEEKAEVQN